MDFTLNDQQKLLKKITREFDEEYVAPVSEEIDQKSK